MTQTTAFPLHRPELLAPLRRGEETLARMMEPNVRQAPAGAVVVEADREHEFVYRVRNGWLARRRVLDDGRSKLIMIFLPGDLFAVKSVFLTRHPDAIEALCPAEIEMLHHAELRAVYEADPAVAMRCTWQVMEEERRLHNWIVGLGRGSARERLALMLVDLRGRLALAGRIGPESLEFEFPLNQEQIGDHIGVSNVHVSRIVRQLREEEIAAFGHRTARILDPARLAAVARPLLDIFQRTNAVFGPLPGGADG